MSEAHKKALTKINKLNAGLKSVKRELAVKTNELKASQDEADNAFKKLAEMTRMYLDLKEGIDRMHSKLNQASETKGEG